MERQVVLIRGCKGPEDAYKVILEKAKLSVHFVKALEFDYVNLEQLASALEKKHAGLIFTSQTAVESAVLAIPLTKGMKAGFLEQWKDLPVFVVGKATARAVAQLGLKSKGSVCGNAEVLSSTIKEFFSELDKSTVLPLLFPRGNLARDTVTSELERVGLKVNSVVCYNTTQEPTIEESLRALTERKVFGSRCCIVFFSPSGVEFVLPFLKLHCDLKDIKVVAIGPTTAASLQLAGVFPVMAHAPTPNAVLEAVHTCEC